MSLFNLDTYVNELKALLLRKATEQVYKLLVDKFVFFAGGPQAYLAKKVITWILKKAIYQTEMACFFKYTDIRADYQGRKLYEAMKRNHHVQTEGLSEDARKLAEQELVDRFRNFVKLTN